MKLNEVINWHIYNYPSLYRHDDLEKSSILVLSHIFLGYGTGEEWHPDGFLCYCMGGYNFTHVRKTLPKGYFDKELYEFELLNDNKEELHKILKEKNIFHYFRSDYKTKCDCVFEDCTKACGEEYNKWLLDTFSFSSSSYKFLHTAECIYRERKEYNKQEYKEFHPSDICEYSPIVEMIVGRTNSLHVENFDLNFIDPEWVSGAIKVVKESLKYYQDPERHKYDYSYPNEKNIRAAEFRLSDAIKDGREKEHRKNFGIDTGKTIKERLEECWQIHYKSQTSYLNKFLEKFDK